MFTADVVLDSSSQARRLREVLQTPLQYLYSFLQLF